MSEGVDAKTMRALALQSKIDEYEERLLNGRNNIKMLDEILLNLRYTYTKDEKQYNILRDKQERDGGGTE